MFERKQGKEDDRDPFQVERQTNARSALRVLLALYLAYVIYKLIRGYFAGDLGMPMPVYYAALVVFIAAEIAILAFTLRRWRENREKIDRAWARQAAEAPDPETGIEQAAELGDSAAPVIPAEPEDGSEDAP